MDCNTTEKKKRAYRVTPGKVEADPQTIGHVRTDNYVFDLWLPVIGLPALGVFQVYKRLARDGEVRGYKQKDLAKKLGIAPNTLTKANETLAHYGFIEVLEVKGQARLMHKTLTIKVLEPPRSVDIQPEKTLSPWLCEEALTSSPYLSAPGGTHFEPPEDHGLNSQLLKTSTIEDLSLANLLSTSSNTGNTKVKSKTYTLVEFQEFLEKSFPNGLTGDYDTDSILSTIMGKIKHGSLTSLDIETYTDNLRRLGHVTQCA